MCSRGYESRSAGDKSNENTDDIIDGLLPEEEEEDGTTSVMKKPVRLDRQGEPYGPMKVQFGRDIQKYAKDLDITVGWEAQTQENRRRLFKRLYTGEPLKLCEFKLRMSILSLLLSLRRRLI